MLIFQKCDVIFSWTAMKRTVHEFFFEHFKLDILKSLINEQGGYVVFLVLREKLFIRDFRVFNPNLTCHQTLFTEPF